MMRIVLLAVFTLVLSGCQVVFVPIPLDVERAQTAIAEAATPMVFPTPTPSPDLTGALGTQADRDTFKAKYNALDVPYKALYAQLDAINFSDPVWRDKTTQAAQAWRAAIDDLRNMPQPQGTRWDAAWPVLMQGLDEYAAAAGAVESATTMNDPVLMEPARGHLIDGVNLVGEAMRLLGQD